MAKGDNKRVQDNIRQSQDRTNQQYQNLQLENDESLRQRQAAGAAERAGLISGYQNLNTTGGINPEDAARLRGLSRVGIESSGGGSSEGSSGGGGSIGGGSIGPSTPLYSDLHSRYTNFANTGGVDIGKLEEALPGFREISGREGGFDSNRLSNINAASSGLLGIGRTGGIPASELAKLRGGADTLQNYGVTGGLTPEEIARYRDPGYEEFANTGGLSARDIDTARAGIASNVQAVNNANRRRLEQARAINPSGANYAAAIASSARQNALASGDALLSGEISLQDAIRSGRQWGITGRAGQEASLGNLLSQNRINATNAGISARNAIENNLVQNQLAGLRSSGDLDLNTQQSINQARLAALSGISDTNYGAQNLSQQGKLAGLGGMFGIEQAREASRLADAARESSASSARYASDQANDRWEREFSADNERFLIDNMLSGRVAGMEGLGRAYTSTYAPESEMLQYRYGLPGQQAQLNQGYIADRTRAAAIPGSWQTGFNNVMQGAGAVAGLAGAFGGGGAGMPGTSYNETIPRPTSGLNIRRR